MVNYCAMWGLTLDLKITAGQRRSDLKMSDESERVFEAIARDLATTGKIDQSVTVECLAVLNEIVRPAIRTAKEKIKSNRLIFDDSSAKPSIIVTGDTPGAFDELIFECNGNQFIMTPTVREVSTPTDAPMRDVSEKLVTWQINNFLRQALKLPPSKATL
jgi:hypothetical protein